jgi:hypothetical protein
MSTDEKQSKDDKSESSCDANRIFELDQLEKVTEIDLPDEDFEAPVEELVVKDFFRRHGAQVRPDQVEAIIPSPRILSPIQQYMQQNDNRYGRSFAVVSRLGGVQ